MTHTVNGRASARLVQQMEKQDQAYRTAELMEELKPLGADIRSRIKVAERAVTKAEEHYKAAGLQLIAVQKRIADAIIFDQAKSFRAFLAENGIGRTRAYELIAIAEGTTTVAGLRMKAAERAARHAKRNRDARSSVTNGQDDKPWDAKAELAKAKSVVARKGKPAVAMDTTALQDFAADLFKRFSAEEIPSLIENLKAFDPTDVVMELRNLADDEERMKALLPYDEEEMLPLAA